MTEKRFTTDYYDFVRDDRTYIKDNNVRMTYEQIVDLLNENEELKQQNRQLNLIGEKQPDFIRSKGYTIQELINFARDGSHDKKPFLKIHDDYFIQYGDEGILFSMHKPSDIRSLMHIINREHGYSELQCEYNDLEMK